ncbi:MULTISPECIES: ABC transporter permease [unclassified Leifsonia]|uniref:ABC transporter permease n=1 Tax=unclassified Leifsonia TaxID=2663824 RepID=UPI0006F860D6|nr:MULTISPECIES: ABC transporter permease [unclassified Leifsonia]KQX08501.1 ABC transporter permease [Leifsonia sp. Root1293]KRA12786.1 ABC transporter permease [Leifsonia sp. Root60]
MGLIAQALQWLADPASWSGDGGIWARLAEHLAITIAVVLISAVITIPVGVLVGHRRRGTFGVALVAGAARAVPTLGLLTLLGLAVGIGLVAPMIALIVLAAPSILAGTYSGVMAVSSEVVDGARAQGMSELQIVFGIEIPLAAPSLLGGIRSATLQVVATATLAAYVADAGLGRYIFMGLKTRNYAELIAGSLLVVTLALLLDGIFVLIQKRFSFRSNATRHHLTERTS